MRRFEFCVELIERGDNPIEFSLAGRAQRGQFFRWRHSDRVFERAHAGRPAMQKPKHSRA